MVNSKNKIGLGSLSLLFCLLGIIFAFSFGDKGCFGDVILRFLALKAWSNGTNGVHYTIFYSLIFFILSVIMGFKFKENIGASLGKIASSIILVLLIMLISFSAVIA